jgi:hypothetical protein
MCILLYRNVDSLREFETTVVKNLNISFEAINTKHIMAYMKFRHRKGERAPWQAGIHVYSSFELLTN